MNSNYYIPAPIALFVFNRPHHTLETLLALSKNDNAEKSILYIYCDGPKDNATLEEQQKINEVREIVESQKWPKKIIVYKSKTNIGLKESILKGVTQVVNKHGKIIVLEDDIVTSRGFLNYMNNALYKYENNKEVMHIGAFMPKTTVYFPLSEIFFSPFMSCWGWATWKSRWQNLDLDTTNLLSRLSDNKTLYRFNLDGTLEHHHQLMANANGKLSTWAIYWYATIFFSNGLCLYPNRSMVKNIGFDNTGVNCGDEIELYDVDLKEITKVRIKRAVESKIGRNYLKRFYNFGTDSSVSKRLRIVTQFYIIVLRIKLGYIKKTILNLK